MFTDGDDADDLEEDSEPSEAEFIDCAEPSALVTVMLEDAVSIGAECETLISGDGSAMESGTLSSCSMNAGEVSFLAFLQKISIVIYPALLSDMLKR